MENNTFEYSEITVLSTCLLIEQRRYENDADYDGDRNVVISEIKHRINVQLANSDPSREMVIGLDEEHWNEIIRVLEHLSHPRGANWDNEFDVQYSVATIAEDMLNILREKRQR